MGIQFISASIKKMMKWVLIATFLATNVLSKTFLIETVDEEDNRRRQREDTGSDYGEDYHNGLPCNAAQGFDPLACRDAEGRRLTNQQIAAIGALKHVSISAINTVLQQHAG